MDEGRHAIRDLRTEPARCPHALVRITGLECLGRLGNVFEEFGLGDLALLEDIFAPIEQRTFGVDRDRNDLAVDRMGRAQSSAEILVIPIGFSERLVVDERLQVGIPASLFEHETFANGQRHVAVEIGCFGLHDGRQAGAELLLAEHVHLHFHAGFFGELLSKVTQRLCPRMVVEQDVDFLSLVLLPVDLRRRRSRQTRCGNGPNRHRHED